MAPDDLDAVMRRFDIRLLLQFGSTVTGRTHARSDMDVAVDRGRPLASLMELADLMSELERLFPQREVDVVEIRRADPLLLKQIASSCRLLFGSQRGLHEFQIYAYKRYQDHRRYLRMEAEYVARVCSRHHR